MQAGQEKDYKCLVVCESYLKNFEQWIFLDALLNPDIKLVTCFGRAGTGKTFLSIAAALSQVLSDFSPYKKLYVSRPVVQIGKDIGALPGTKEEKLSPYIQPYFDNLEVLFSRTGAPAAAQVPSSSKQSLLTILGGRPGRDPNKQKKKKS
jgi:predicted ribonuclease YlaK